MPVGFRPAGAYRCDGRNVPGQVVDDPSEEFPGSWRGISAGELPTISGVLPADRAAGLVSCTTATPAVAARSTSSSYGRTLLPAIGSGQSCLSLPTPVLELHPLKTLQSADPSTCDGSRRNSCAPAKPSTPWLPRQHEDVIVGDIGNHHGGFRSRVSPADGVADDLHHGRFKCFPAVGQAFDMRAFLDEIPRRYSRHTLHSIELGPYEGKPASPQEKRATVPASCFRNQKCYRDATMA